MKLRSLLRDVALTMILILLIWCVYGIARVATAQVPETAYQYQRSAFAAWRDQFGLDAPTATLAAQVHQESSWRPDARSPYAYGLTQFTPATASDIARWNRDLAPADPGDPRWSLRAQAYYMDRIMSRYPGAIEAWLMALAGYNSGPGWTDRSRAVCRSAPGCDADRWAGHVEHAIDPRHADWAVAENRHYVRRILRELGPRYERAGWGRAVSDPWSCQP